MTQQIGKEPTTPLLVPDGGMPHELRVLAEVLPLFGVQDLEQENRSGLPVTQFARLGIGHEDDELELSSRSGLVHLRFHVGAVEPYDPDHHGSLPNCGAMFADGQCQMEVTHCQPPNEDYVLVSLEVEVPASLFSATTVLDAAHAWAVWRADEVGRFSGHLPAMRDSWRMEELAADRLGTTPFPDPPPYQPGLQQIAGVLAPYQGALFSGWRWSSERGWPKLVLQVALDDSRVAVLVTEDGLKVRRGHPAWPLEEVCPRPADLPRVVWQTLFHGWAQLGLLALPEWAE